jgi:DNA processing protein
VPEGAFAAALAMVPGVGPALLRRLLDGASPSSAWASLREARVPELAPLAAQAEGLDVEEAWTAHRRAGIDVLVRGGPGYPEVLAGDPEAPAVLFVLGEPSVVDQAPRVAVVGTRTATRYGLGVAAQLGADLAGAGIVVVSGLAMGIDGAAHEGAHAGWQAGRPTSGPPVGVAAGGLDEAYPRRHAGLWRRVAEAGAVLSESPAGIAPQRWRFPRRNRLMAALSDVVVVVECHQHGGSLLTVHAAQQRGIAVGAVPGSIRSPASAGANDLLADGCFPVRDATDVLTAVALAHAGALPVQPVRRRTGSPDGDRVATASEVGARMAAAVAESVGESPATGDIEVTGAHGGSHSVRAGRSESSPATGDDAVVLQAIEYEQASVEQLLRRTGLPLARVCAALERLAAEGRVRGDGGWWDTA